MKNTIFYANNSNFMDELARGMLVRYGDPALLASCFVLLPTRRSCNALRDEIMRLRGRRATMLPNIYGLGEASKYLPLLARRELARFPSAPPISHMERHLLLCDMVVRHYRMHGEGDISFEHASYMASSLASLIDEMEAEGCDISSLAGAVPHEYARHWEETLDFLRIITEQWPQELARLGCVDRAARHRDMLHFLADLWEAEPPSHPVIIAGSTGSQEATRRLMKAVAAAPSGAVIISGAVEEGADLRTPSHPQYMVRRALQHIGAMPRNVRRWADAAAQHTGHGELSIVEADGLYMEAEIIALRLRAAVQHRGRNVALVTPDARLSRAVKLRLERFGIYIDDTAGQKLEDTEAGVISRLALDVAAHNFAPQHLLALLHHPLVHIGYERAELLRLTSLVDKYLLRGRNVDNALEAIAAPQHREISDEDELHLISLAQKLRELFTPLSNAMLQLRTGNASIADIATQHIAALQQISEYDNAEGAEEVSDMFDDLLSAHSAHDKRAYPIDYAEFFASLWAGRAYRSQKNLHPNLHILSPLEARLLHFDVLILGGLNAESWPPTQHNPFINQSMRRALGLPTDEHRLGQASRDFEAFLQCSNIMLTRSRTRDGALLAPCTWWLHLERKLSDAGQLQNALARGGEYKNLATYTMHNLHKMNDLFASANMASGGNAKPSRPAPNPPVSARPRTISITQAERLIKDPYSIYAELILQLRPLDKINHIQEQRLYGEALHLLMQFIAVQHNSGETNAAPQHYTVGFIDQVLKKYAHLEHTADLWRPRMQILADAAPQHEIIAAPLEIDTEMSHKAHISLGANSYHIRGRVDYAALQYDGVMQVIDYKTSQPPSGNDIKSCKAPQLPLSTLLALAKLHETDPERADNISNATMRYIVIGGAKPFEEKINVKYEDCLPALRKLCEETIPRLLFTQTPLYSCPNPSYQLRYNDYLHLARLPSWFGS